MMHGYTMESLICTPSVLQQSLLSCPLALFHFHAGSCMQSCACSQAYLEQRKKAELTAEQKAMKKFYRRAGMPLRVPDD